MITVEQWGRGIPQIGMFKLQDLLFNGRPKVKATILKFIDISFYNCVHKI